VVKWNIFLKQLAAQLSQKYLRKSANAQAMIRRVPARCHL